MLTLSSSLLGKWPASYLLQLFAVSLLDSVSVIRSIDGDVSHLIPHEPEGAVCLSVMSDSNIDMEKCEEKYSPFGHKLMRNLRLPKQEHQWVRTNLLFVLNIVTKSGYFQLLVTTRCGSNTCQSLVGGFCPATFDNIISWGKAHMAPVK
jgi:hypothetical protein